MKKEIRIGDKSPYDAFCSRCCTKFSNKSNLRRHLKGRRSPCKLGEQSGRIWIEDEQTGNTRLLRPEERAQWTRRRKRENYIRKAPLLKEKARRRARDRRGRQGSMPWMERFRWNIVWWRRIIRSVHHLDKTKTEIHTQSVVLAFENTPRPTRLSPHTPRPKKSSAEVKGLYKEMRRIYANHPHIWDGQANTWNDDYFDWDDSGSEPYSDLERIYDPEKYEDEISDGEWD